MRILVVDWNFDSLWIIASWLRAWVRLVCVASAASGAEALQLMHQMEADVVLVDVDLQDMEGLELARRLKAEPRAPAVVIMTSTEDESLRAESHAAEADMCLEKAHLQDQLPKFLQQRFGVLAAAATR